MMRVTIMIDEDVAQLLLKYQLVEIEATGKQCNRTRAVNNIIREALS